MAYHGFNTSLKRIFRGNALFVICCGFYLAWWLLAFKPVGAVKGIKNRLAAASGFRVGHGGRVDGARPVPLRNGIGPEDEKAGARRRSAGSLEAPRWPAR